MTFRARIVRLTLGAALVSAGLAAYVHEVSARPVAWLTFAAVGAVALGLAVVLRAIAPESTGGTEG